MSCQLKQENSLNVCWSEAIEPLAGCSNWFVLFIWSVWFNQTNETNQINQITVFFC